MLCLPRVFRQAAKNPGAGLHPWLTEPWDAAAFSVGTGDLLHQQQHVCQMNPPSAKVGSNEIEAEKKEKKSNQNQLDSPLLLLPRNLGSLSIKQHKHFTLAVATLGLY